MPSKIVFVPLTVSYTTCLLYTSVILQDDLFAVKAALRRREYRLRIGQGLSLIHIFKAIANEYAADGLRLVEVKKNQLYQIPDLMDQLAANPLKFILFIDDLSFSSNDDNFAALKAILEGSVGGRARNIAVYATSNRRHLIKETLTDRTGDDIHEADTRQELMSLSARFGLTVTFQRPEKARFAAILEELAKQHHIQMPMEELLVKLSLIHISAGARWQRLGVLALISLKSFRSMGTPAS